MRTIFLIPLNTHTLFLLCAQSHDWLRFSSGQWIFELFPAFFAETVLTVAPNPDISRQTEKIAQKTCSFSKNKIPPSFMYVLQTNLSSSAG